VVVARFSEEEREKIWDMREAGVSVKRIAKHCYPRPTATGLVSTTRAGAATADHYALTTRRTRASPDVTRLALVVGSFLSDDLGDGTAVGSRKPSTVRLDIEGAGL
jgi:hypothetical protein